MSYSELPLNQIIHGDSLDILTQLPEKSIDLIFADPPYNLQLSQALWRPNQTRVAAVDDDWDQFASFEAYDEFCYTWLRECKRILKPTGSIWVIGSYHNIYRIGSIMQNLGYWILNDVLWIKSNPMPNFRGVRFTNAHETLIWASSGKDARYAFNHHAMKAFNDGKQMRSDWLIPLCTGAERIKVNGKKAHSTQKPEALLYRVLLSSTRVGDVVLDPFFGSGTTGAVAKRLQRHYIGIEREEKYVHINSERIDKVCSLSVDEIVMDVSDRRRRAVRVPFVTLLERGWILPGTKLYFRGERKISARVKPDGKLLMSNMEGSIHQAGKHLASGKPCNGWDCWYFENDAGELQKIDILRTKLRAELKSEGHS
ncbi:MAG: site-specific DNA-methyltransferase [Phycisphaerae bacterium]|nr:site-specific DNA-methyltransferase [Phycisphaerae bacterium]